jgi:chromosome segregation ATPase
MIQHALRAAGFAGLIALACSNQKPEPLYGSSAGQPSYAERYPERLGGTRGEYVEKESKAARLQSEFATYPEELSDPQWDHVEQVVVLADEAGQSGAYVQRLEENERVEAFFDEEKDELNKKVGGAAQYAAKQKNCDIDAYGATTHALEKAVEKQLEERLREHNEAHLYIDEHEEELGKPNIDKLKKQADDISYASYVAHVAGKQAKAELEEMIGEASQVESTLDKTIEDAQKVQNDEKASERRKKRAAERLERAQTAKNRIKSEVEQAQSALKELDQKIQQAEAAYDKALDELKQKIKAKAEQQPAKA